MMDARSRKLEWCKWKASARLSALFAAMYWRRCCSCHTCVWMVLRPPANRVFIIKWVGWDKVVLNANV